MFSEQKKQTQINTRQGVQVIQSLRVYQWQFPQNSASRRASRLLVEMIQPQRLHQPVLHFSHYTETGQQMKQLTHPRLDHYPSFLRVLQTSCHPQTTGSNLENMTPTFPSDVGCPSVCCEYD